MPRTAPRQPAGRRRASIRQAAEYAGVSSRTIRRYIVAGRITGYRIGPKLLKVDLNEIDRIITPVPAAAAG
jgi:excisionase family DNA binding protein